MHTQVLEQVSRVFIFSTLALIISCGGSEDNGSNTGGLTSLPEYQEININIEAYRLSGEFLVNSMTHNPQSFEDYFFSATSTGSRESDTDMGMWSDSEFDLSLIADDYEIIYTTVFGNSSTNDGELLEGPITLDSDKVENINVTTVDVTFELSLNGNPFPSSAAERAGIYLQSLNSVSESPFLAGYTDDGTLDISIIPGTYHVYYQYETGTQIPINLNARVAENLSIDSSQLINLAIESSSIRSLFLLDGENYNAPNAAINYAKMVLKNSAGDRVEIGETFESPTLHQVIYGKYNAHYGAREAQGLVPVNPDAIVVSDITIDSPAQELTIDVQSVEIEGEFSINGGPMPQSMAVNYGRIYFEDIQTQARFLIGDSFYTYPLIKIVAGTYDVIYDNREYNSLVPANQDTVFIKSQEFKESGTFNIDIPLIELVLDMTLDGEAFPSQANSYAKIYAREQSSEEFLELGQTFFFPFTWYVLPGTYDFYYEVAETVNMPINRFSKLLEGVEINQSQTVVHDLKSKKIRLNFTLNGEPFPSLANAYARIFMGTSEEDRFQVTDTNVNSEGQKVLVGDYDLIYTIREPLDDITIPINTSKHFHSLRVE